MTEEAIGIEQWRVAMRWRRQVDRELAVLGLTLTQWLVLDATHTLVLERGDAVSQNDVAARTELTKMAVSRAMCALQRLGLVDRGPDFLYHAVRVILTKRGKRVREQGRALIERVE